MKSHWIECLKCGYVWLAYFASEMGCLFAADECGESCSECGSDDIEVGEEYTKGDCA